MTTEIDFFALTRPFHPSELEWRAQAEGDRNGQPWVRCVCYVDNRAIMNRLDEVCGPENWCNEFKPGPGGQPGAVSCGIGIRVGGGWVVKWDGADSSDIEAVKGGISDAMKRAAVQWGIGRYLYEVEASFAQIVDTRQDGAKPCKNKGFFWLPPAMPAKFLPRATESKENAKDSAKVAELLKELASLKRLVGPCTKKLAEAINVEFDRLGLEERSEPESYANYAAAIAVLDKLKAIPTPPETLADLPQPGEVPEVMKAAE